MNAQLIENRLIPIFMFLLGIGIFFIWIADMLKGKFAGQGNFFKWREGENMLWPHIFAEFLTAGLLILSAAGLFFTFIWALKLSLLSFGAVIYSSINSSAWVLAEKKRLPYGIPMWIGLTGSIISVLILIL
ncbi:MAG: hypothetical protein K9H49_17455 [Bacteroidales bacterium]|nr:hypothetical protein [Bacteroidales bacterium]MCF8390205.1 hypothetical protein [Bacteroidales bacterium]